LRSQAQRHEVAGARRRTAGQRDFTLTVDHARQIGSRGGQQDRSGGTKHERHVGSQSALDMFQGNPVRQLQVTDPDIARIQTGHTVGQRRV